jgi:hypothetical protein
VVVDAGAGHRAAVKVPIPEGAGGSAAGGTPVVVSEGPSREEFTRFPWAKVGWGLAAIGLLGLALRFALKFMVARKEGTSP